MVGWYDPALAQSARLMTLANIFGLALRTTPDRGAREPAAASASSSSRVDPVTGEFWLDHVSDVADGWNPTFAIAERWPSRELEVAAMAGASTRGGQVLVFGGDEVYPYPSKAYTDAHRGAVPGRIRGRGASSGVFAVPGNHDWYDSLVAFSRSFCRSDAASPAARRSRRSYFALKLPHDWWLAGDGPVLAPTSTSRRSYFRDGVADAG